MIRQWALFLILLLLVQASAIGLVYVKHLNRKLFVELQASQRVRDQLMIEFGQLQLEQSTWSTHGRIERIAHQKLQMRMPDYAAVEIISR